MVRKHLYLLTSREEECINDTLLAIWENWVSFDSSRSSFKNWICAIARYRAINYLKKYAKDLEQIPIEDFAPYLLSRQEEPLHKEIWQLEIEKLLEPLSEQDQKLFVDLFTHEYSVSYLSKKYNLSEENIYQRVSRGRKKLKKRRAENGHSL